VDTTYKSDLRELNDVNWTRFDAKLEQRVSEVRSEIQSLKADVRGDLEKLKAELIKWMFLFWTATAFAGLLFKALGWAAP